MELDLPHFLTNQNLICMQWQSQAVLEISAAASGSKAQKLAEAALLEASLVAVIRRTGALWR